MDDRQELQQSSKCPPARRLRVGSRILADAYSSDGTLLLRAGAKVGTVAELGRLSQPDVRFGDGQFDQIPLDMENEAALDLAETQQSEEVADFGRRLALASVIKSGVVDSIESVFDAISSGETVDLDVAGKAVSCLLDELLEDPRALVSLAQLKNVDAYTYTHCVNVAILTMHLALHTGYRGEIEDVGVGALLHDIGKSRIALDVLNKPGPLTASEFKLMRKHPEYGLEQLHRAGETRQIVNSCVLSHHEKVSGKGYPHGKRGRHICPYAMMTSIADIYDAFTTDRPYHLALSPKDTLTLMARNFRDDLREDLLECFISIIGFYPVGSRVELSNGYLAHVLKHYATHPNEPAVVLVADPQGNPLPKSNVVELTNEPDLFIRQFVRQDRFFSASMAEQDDVRKAA